MQRRCIGRINFGLISFGQIGSDLSDSNGLDLIGLDLIGSGFIGRFASVTGGHRASTGLSRRLTTVLRTATAALKPAHLFRNRALRGALYLIRGVLKWEGEFSGLRPCSAPVLTKH